MWPRHRDSRHSTDTRGGNQSVLVSQSGRKAARGEAATAPDVPEARDQGRAARFSLELPELGRPRRRIIRARLSRRRWRMWSRTRSRRPIAARICSSAAAGSWTTGPPIWLASVETRRPDRSADPAGLVIGSVASRLAQVSQSTLWGHASRVPGRGWRGAVPPLTPPTATAHHGRWTRRGARPTSVSPARPDG